MADTLKKGFTLVVLAFLLFFAVAHPAEAADKVNAAIGFIEDLFRGIDTFFNKLAG